MVYYFIIAPDGNRYGPADIDTLVRWTSEGRLVADTILIERGTERQLRADALTAIDATLKRMNAAPAAVAVDQDSREAPTMTQAPRTPPPPPPPPSTPCLREPTYAISPKSKVLAGVLALLFGALGAHRFYLGYRRVGVIMLILATVFARPSRGVSTTIAFVWGFVEGVVILTGGFRDSNGRPVLS